MKRYASRHSLVIVLIVGAFASVPCRLDAQAKPPTGHVSGQVSDVFLLLRGPLVFCESQENGKAVLRAILPPIVGDKIDKKVRHFKPAFYSNDSIYLGEGDYRLQILPEATRGGQIDKSQGTLDSIYKPCPLAAQKYLSLVFPMPDDITPVAPVHADFDDNCDGHFSHENYYATQVGFRYRNVSLDDVMLLCEGGNCKNPGEPPFPFDPKVRYFPGLGGLMHFEVTPKFEDNPLNPHEHALAVAKTMRTLIGDENHHCLHPLDNHGRTSDHQGRSLKTMENRTPSRDCHATELLLCDPSGSKLCQTN